MDTRRIVDNRTPMVAQCLPMDDAAGHPVLVVITKMTWEVPAGGAPRVAERAAPVRFGTELRAGPGSSVRYPNDLADQKPGTDVLLLGTAHPPPGSEEPGKEVSSVDVRLCVAGHGVVIDKSLRVYGPRVWQRGVGSGGLIPGPAARLSATPLCYENAYGGSDCRDLGNVVREPRNPVGKGVARDRSTLLGQPAPVIEDPRPTVAGRVLAPAGFGPIPAHWTPRANRGGTHDAAWRRTRAPLKPHDYNPRFACWAPDDQWSKQPLVGDEAVEILGATPEGAWRFKLPAYAPVFESRVAGEERKHETHLDTFLIDADERRIELCWRMSLRLPRKTEAIEWVRIWQSQELPPEAIQPGLERIRARPGMVDERA